MSTLTYELERTAHDLATAPSFRENIEIGIAGALAGAALGYLSKQDKSEAYRYAKWGAGIGIAGQYLVFHMLRPAMRQFQGSALRAAHYGHHMTGLDAGLTGFPQNYADWEGAHLTAGEFIPNQLVIVDGGAPYYNNSSPATMANTTSGIVPDGATGATGYARIVGRNQPAKLYSVEDTDHPGHRIWVAEQFVHECVECKGWSR